MSRKLNVMEKVLLIKLSNLSDKVQTMEFPKADYENALRKNKAWVSKWALVVEEKKEESNTKAFGFNLGNTIKTEGILTTTPKEEPKTEIKKRGRKPKE